MRRVSQWVFILLFPMVVGGCALFGKTDKPEEPLQPEVASGVAPKVVLPQTTFDFGQITEDKDYSHEFVVKNEGMGVLKIREVVPD